MSATAETVLGRPMTDYGCDADGCTRSLLLSGKDTPPLRRIAAAAGWQVTDDQVACPRHATPNEGGTP